MTAANQLRTWMFVCGLLAAAGAAGAETEDKAKALEADVTQGALRIQRPDGSIVECPLKHTDVQIDVAGFIARAQVTQTFHNPLKEKIEAVYVFPLPHEAAVDAMTMLVGERRIVGVIKRRDEARQIYEQALLAGQTAALLEQERPNIFTQSVGNIEPGQEVKIEISYVDVLRYDLGVYEMAFPMVVGPRYNPGYPMSAPPGTPQELTGKVSPPVSDTSRVPDASKINPPVLKPGFRNGHDISLRVTLDAGVPIQDLTTTNHQCQVKRDGRSQASIEISPKDSLPNKDFVLRYGVVGEKPEMALLTHTGKYSGDAAKLGNGYFMLMIQPQEDQRLTKSPPREIVYLVDVSGSMRGQPTTKVIDAMRRMLKLCREQDTVQVITFAGQANKLFEKPVPVTEENIRAAVNFSEGLQGAGGTEMLKGVKLAIDEPLDDKRLRIVVMLTDGYIGNEAEIIEHVGKHCGDKIRFWCVGIGSSPNMFLVDGVAKQGGGMGKQLGLEDETEPLTQEIMTRIQRAQLADVQIDWGGLNVSETYPARIPELWAGRPIVVFGRYAEGGRIAGKNWQATVKVSGKIEGEPAEWPLEVRLPVEQPEHNVLAKTWARRKIEELMQQTYYHGSPAVEEMVTAIALDYGLMSQYTSFVAVDEKDAEKQNEMARPPRRMLVPVPLPAGTQWEGFFGEDPQHRWDVALGEKGVMLGVELALEGRFGRAKEALAKMPASGTAYFRQGAPAPMAGGLAGGRGGFGGGFGGGIADGLSRGWGTMPQQQLARRGRATAAGAGPVPGQQLRLFSRGGEVAAANGHGLAADSLKQLADVQFDYEGKSLAGHALQPQAQALFQAAQQQLEAAKKHQEQKEVQPARDAFLRAYFLAAAAANVAYPQTDIASATLAELEELHAARVKQWSDEQPALKKRLDLVLRNLSLEEALAKVAESAGLTIDLVEDSKSDVQQLTGLDEVRVSYLDLRGATVAEALDWMLQPLRMAWRPVGQAASLPRITVGAERRLPGNSAWIYDVATLALPEQQDPANPQDQAQAVAAAKAALDQFLSAAKKHLTIESADAIVWFAPGQLLIFGDAKRHAAAQQLFTSLAQAEPRLDGELAVVQQVTAKRAAARKDELAKHQAARQRLQAAAAHTEFAWRLLAAAADGRLDLEALTELQIAWRSPQTAELLDGPAAAIVLRSAWIAGEASRALPGEAELAKLAETAQARTQKAAQASLDAIQKSPADSSAFAAALYASLLMRDDPQFVSQARKLLAPKEEADDLAAARQLAAELLNPAGESQSLIELADEGVMGDDMTALLALACHRAGGKAWDTFRAAARDLLGDQPLSGHVVVFVNRLPQGHVR